MTEKNETRGMWLSGTAGGRGCPVPRTPVGQQPRPPAVPLLAALVLLCALALATAPAAFAADTNVVGETITVPIPESDEFPGSGTLEFSITAVAPDEETPGAVRLNSGTTYKGELVLDQVEYGECRYAVTSVAANAFKNNTALTGIEFRSDLTGESSLTPGSILGALGASAFEGCSNLESVAFPQKIAGIGNSAFSNCTALASVTFAEGAELYSRSRGTTVRRLPAIGNSAFANCTALTTITIPAITSTQRSPDRYSTYGDLTGSTPIEGNNPPMYSGYANAFNTGSTVPVYSRGIDISAFSNCTALETVVFEPSGADWGLFAYFSQEIEHPVFAGCSALKTVVYADEQPYYADYDRAIHSGYGPTYRNVYEVSGVVPALYYAVDYYATNDEAAVSSDNGFASGRYARVEYLRGTSTAALATSNAAVLADAVYAGVSAYAKDGYADGTIPNPQQVAVAAGLDSTVKWVWKLGGTQSRRAGLNDSCYAYLAEAGELSAGRVAATYGQIATMYKLCGQNLSQGQEPAKDSPFDAARYYTYTSVGFDAYRFEPNPNLPYGVDGLFLNAGETAWFTLTSSVEQSFLSQIQIYAADGTQLDAEDYGVTFERYDVASEGLVEATLGSEEDGPLLMTITPGAESGYTGDLKEWVLVKGHTGSVRENYTADPTSTWWRAIYYDNTSDTSPDTITTVSPFTGPYAVAISSADPSSALIAASYAGLTSAPINVLDTTDTSYGFALSTEFGSGNGAISREIDPLSFSVEGFTPSEFAVAAYQVFEERLRTSLGTSASAYPWGDTALIITPDSVQDVAAGVAAYAYAKAAPVFYTEEDGTVSEDTLACLRKFSRVLVMGDEILFTLASYNTLRAALQPDFVEETLHPSSVAAPLGTAVYDGLFTTLSSEGGGDDEPAATTDVELARISGDAGSACSLSLAVAWLLLAEEPPAVSPAVVTITDATEVADIVAALNLSGHEGGLALTSACTVDSKLISAFLRELRDEVGIVRQFGRPTSQLADTASFNLSDSLSNLWSSDEAVYTAATPEVGPGDTVVLYGAEFTIESSGDTNSLAYVDRLWEGPGLAASDDIAYGGQIYVLPEAAAKETGTPPNLSPGSDEKPSGSSKNPIITGSNDKPKTDDPKDDTKDDPKPTIPADTPNTDTKVPGRLVVTTPQVASSQTGGTLVSGGSGSSSNSTNTGTLGVSQMTVADSDGEETNALADRRQSTPRDLTDFATESADTIDEATETPTDQPRGTNPVLAAALIGSAVAALAVALWFALRRRKPVPALTTPEGPAPPEDATPPEDLMEE